MYMIYVIWRESREIHVWVMLHVFYLLGNGQTWGHHKSPLYSPVASSTHILHAYIHVCIHKYTHTWYPGVCEKTPLLREPWSCNPAAETADQPQIWCFQSWCCNQSPYPEECFCSQTPVCQSMLSTHYCTYTAMPMCTPMHPSAHKGAASTIASSCTSIWTLWLVVVVVLVLVLVLVLVVVVVVVVALVWLLLLILIVMLLLL